ncbi:uncharacterized protein LOC121863446 [Homarus americanus]|uniref:uncharacterized protein LOC121863446 n=1 Tax=Homarus americanus TaxID=6706 RepID=UPI001C4501D6|nr:uncharacterized protein LOC121863446 [Homarus americanus]
MDLKASCLFFLVFVLLDVDSVCGEEDYSPTSSGPQALDAIPVPEFVKERLQGIRFNLPEELHSLVNYSVNTQVSPIIMEENVHFGKENVASILGKLFPLPFVYSSNKNLTSNIKTSGKHKATVPLQLQQTGHNTRVSGESAHCSSASGLNSCCLKPLYCYSDKPGPINFNHLEIHHWDLPERSAAACGTLCLQLRPSTQLVFTKMIEMNERLVCGCGDRSAITSEDYVMNGFFACRLCPDGKQQCGGPNAVSVYELDRAVTVSHNLESVGCFQVVDIKRTYNVTYLKEPNRSVNACAQHCRTVSPDNHLTIVQYQNTQSESSLFCSCGSNDAVLKDVSPVNESECWWICPDGGSACGGPNTYSIYSSATWIPRTSKSLLLVMLYLLCALLK